MGGKAKRSCSISLEEDQSVDTGLNVCLTMASPRSSNIYSCMSEMVQHRHICIDPATGQVLEKAGSRLSCQAVTFQKTNTKSSQQTAG